jgi:hypothetical protein
MNADCVEHTVRELALNLSQSMGSRVLVETDKRTVLDRDIVELRVYLREVNGSMTATRWAALYRQRLAVALDSIELELAVDEWFIPSQRFPSCGCWIMGPSVKLPIQKRLNAI